MTQQDIRFSVTARDSATNVFRNVEKALAGLAGRSDDFGKSMGAASGIIDGAVGRFAAFAGASLSVAAAVERFNTAVGGLDALNDLADATGASIENLSALQDIARRTGTSMSGVESVLVRFNKVLLDAKPGSDAAKVLDAIGLSAEKLRAVDPAEALRQTAVAFAGYADDGNKARSMQELFGKSVREAAPFLKDLAEAGKLNATVTTEQAQQAERFVKQMAALSANADNLARSLVGRLLPALNDSLSLLQRLSAGPGLLASLGEVFKGNQFTSVQQGLDYYSGKIKEIDSQITALRNDKRPLVQAFNASGIKTLEDERAKLERFADAYRDVLNAGGSGAGRGTYRGEAPKLPDLPGGDAKTTQERAARFEDYAESVRASIGKLADDTQTVKLAKLAEQLKALDELAATGLDPQIVRQVRTALEGLTTVEIPTDELARFAEVTRLLAETPTGQIEQLAALEEKLADAYARGAITAEGFDEALQILEQRFDQIIGPVEDSLESMSTFAEQAQRNIQDALGDTLYQTLAGNFDSIGELWSNLLKRMVAEAIAVDLNNAIFGTSKGGGVGDLVGGLGKLFGGFFADGGTLGAGKWGIAGEAGPEVIRGPATITPMAQLQSTAQQPALTQVFNLGQGVTEAQLLRAMAVAREQGAALGYARVRQSTGRSAS